MNFSKGSTFPIVLAGAAIFGALTFLGLSAAPFNSGIFVDMRTEPQQGLLTVGENFTVNIIVESNIPVNAFAGEMHFNSDVLQVDKIDYNVSIADLWAELPWYSNGDGILTFAGGTTQPGGFSGVDKLITVTFKTKAKGSGNISIANARVLQHDGFGTDAELEEPIDAIFTIEDPRNLQAEVLRKDAKGTAYVVTEEPPSTDLNNDGKQTIADISIFMMHLAGSNMRSDFNEDGKVNTSDLSIILNAK